MRKKNGFISMSIIYSFFTVFILVSTSLLLIYSNNLSIVKSVNKEIKDQLTKKGNNSLMMEVLKMLQIIGYIIPEQVIMLLYMMNKDTMEIIL